MKQRNTKLELAGKRTILHERNRLSEIMEVGRILKEKYQTCESAGVEAGYGKKKIGNLEITNLSEISKERNPKF